MKLAVVLLVVVILFYAVFPPIIRHLFAQHGMGDQHLTFWLVFGAFITPLLWPIFQLKTLVFNVLLPSWVESTLTLEIGRWLLTPSHKYDVSRNPLEPDYFNSSFWSMLPNRDSDASNIPVGGGEEVVSANKTCSAFYLHPSTWYTSMSWNGDALHPVTSYLSDDAIGPQHANAFNSHCRLFAPRFRQMAAAGFLQPEGLSNENSRQALNLAYSDVKRAFQHFLTEYHRGEPIFLVGHSQGSVLAAMLLDEFFARNTTLHPFLAVAYLPGWTFFENDFSSPTNLVTICESKNQVGCMVSWRTFADHGDAKAFLHIPSQTRKRICVNPLTWKRDLSRIPHSANRGGLDVMHYQTMFRYLTGYKTPSERVRPPVLIPEISDAQCDAKGHLRITAPTHYGYGWGYWPFPAYTFASFPGANLHTYDINLFFGNLQENVKDRVKAWYAHRA